jgi:hypothetical protein
MSSQSDKAKIIYSMSFGEKRKLDNWDVYRVPGGWIFTDTQGGFAEFVPYSEEFKETQES